MDDTAVVGLISDNNESAYRTEIKHLMDWSEHSNLKLNTGKTKELIVDFGRKQQRNLQPICVNGAQVERVDSFKYLGVHTTQDLSWSFHINTFVKKGHQHLFI